MKPPRGLSPGEAEAWARVAVTVQPFHPLRHREGVDADAKPGRKSSRGGEGGSPPPPPPPASRQTADPHRRPHVPPPPRAAEARQTASPGLDSHWERRLRAGTLAPDFTLDLHEHSLDAAYQRLLGGLDMARETGARVVLVIAGRDRPGPAADRAGQRGAIRAKLLDWLAASRHGPAISAIRQAHRRHGGEGALYVILKKPR